MGKLGAGGSKKEKTKIVKIHFFVSGQLWNSDLLPAMLNDWR